MVAGREGERERAGRMKKEKKRGRGGGYGSKDAACLFEVVKIGRGWT